MVKNVSWALGVLVLLSSEPAFAACQPPDEQEAQSSTQQDPRPSVFQDPKQRQELGVTDQQSAAIERIFSMSIQSLRDARKELDAQEAVLSRTIEDGADLLTVSQQIDRVEAARAAYNKMRTLMVYRMNLVLSPEQRAKAKAMMD